MSPQTGKVEWEYDAPASLPWTPWPKAARRDDFDADTLGADWTFWGTPYEDYWKLEDSSLKIRCISKAMAKDLEAMGFGANISRGNYRPFIAKRQLQPCFSASTQMHFCPKGNETAGLAVVQAMNHQLRIEMCSDGEGQVLRGVLLTADWNVPPYFPGFESQTQEQILFETPWNETVAVLRIDMVGEDWSIYAGTAEDRLEKLCSVDGRLINPEKVGCMVGTMLGVFASGNGTDSDNEAVFDWFDCGEI